MSRLRRCRRRSRFLLSCAALISLSACDGDDPSSPDNTVLDRSALIQALRSQGATVEIASPISQPFLSVGGQILRVNGGDVQTFEYASEADAQSDAARNTVVENTLPGGRCQVLSLVTGERSRKPPQPSGVPRQFFGGDPFPFG